MRLDAAERFYDGPIPPVIRRAIFADSENSDAEDPTIWRRHARQSAMRLRTIAPARGQDEDARKIARAYRRELDWCQHCMTRWREARAAQAPSGRVATPAGLEPATTSLEG